MTLGGIDASLRDAPIIDRGGYPYLIHPLTDGVPRASPELLDAWTSWASARPMLGEATVLVAPEAMGPILAAPLAIASGLPYLVVRKREYHLPGEEMAYCETGYGESCLYVNDVQPSDRVVLVDDVVSTGATLEALVETIRGQGATVLGAIAFLEKDGGADALRARAEVDVEVMRRIRVAGGRVEILDLPATAQ